jgi:hypothetical protein
MGLFKWLVIGAIAMSSPGMAQAKEVAPGARVRVTLIDRAQPRIVGTLLALPLAGLEMQAEPDSVARTIARLDIARLEISGGMHSRGGRGAARGAAILGGLGMAFGLFLTSVVPEVEEDVALVSVLGVGGALAGAGLGALMAQGQYERWSRVPVP